MSAHTITLAKPLYTRSGQVISAPVVRFETYGTLDAERANAVLVCHSLTKAAHAVRDGSETPGWWDAAIGPGRMIDTDRYFVICASTLAAAGSSGPDSQDPAIGRHYALRFPVVEVRDMALAHRRLLDHLGISTLRLAIGGCFGGQQVLELGILMGASMRNAVIISTTPATSDHTIAIFSAMRRLIRCDPAWNGGEYYGGPLPAQGLGNAIAVATPLWMNRGSMQARFARALADPSAGYTHGLDGEFAVEAFVDRLVAGAVATIDPNGLMYLTKAVEYFDLAREYGDLPSALESFAARTLFVSYTGDWRYPPDEVATMDDVLTASGHDSKHVVLDSALGHGGFLYDVGGLCSAVEDFLAGDRQ